MTDYKKYINALRKCAKEHENDRTLTGQIIVSNLCEAIADLLEELSSSENLNKSEIPTGSTAKNDLGVDAVSREKVWYMITGGKYSDEDNEKFIDRLVNKLAELPSVTPQEPFMAIPCISSKVCEHDRMVTLDKIRAEIKALSPEPTAYDVVDGNPVKDAIWETLIEVDKIIDKYKAESEDKE